MESWCNRLLNEYMDYIYATEYINWQIIKSEFTKDFINLW